jgi:pimeloyl-ACP methyl ester carboxylesterase
MEIKRRSFFKDPRQDLAWFDNWVRELENSNKRIYDSIQLDTSLGRTHVWGLHTQDESLDTLVIFPGARTSALFWDFDKGLDNLRHPLRIFLVETNGLPNLSEGNTPDIRSAGYGLWAAEVLDKLKIDGAFIAGASFGGLVALKLALACPGRVKAVFLLNPGCLQPFSLSFKNLYYNLLPLLAPSTRNVSRFLNKAVFCKPNHQLSEKAEKLIIDYEVFAITRYQDHTQKPYYMKDQLKQVKPDTFLLVGDKDLLFPFQKSIDNAQANLGSLKEVKVFDQVGHGIETFDKAMNYIGATIKKIAKHES